MSLEFNNWWNGDDLTTDNNFKKDTPAFWAWEGWLAGVKSEREACADVCDERAKGWKDVKLARNDTYAAMQTAAKNEARALANAIRSRSEK